PAARVLGPFATHCEFRGHYSWFSRPRQSTSSAWGRSSRFGAVLREEALGNLGEGPGAGIASIQGPDEVEAVVGPVAGARDLVTGDVPDQRRDMAVVPGDQHRPG